MTDKHYIYRPLLDLIGFTEGTDKGDGYNETLAYGAYTGGDVDLTSMNLKQIDKLQTQMLAHPDNKWNSSALGRYQIVRTTLRKMKKAMKLSDSVAFNAATQDLMACYLMYGRGIDKYIAGTMTEDQIMVALAKEWASLPMPNGKGYYKGQNTPITAARMREVLQTVLYRAKKGPTIVQPPSTINKPAPEPAPVAKEGLFMRIMRWIFGG